MTPTPFTPGAGFSPPGADRPEMPLSVTERDMHGALQILAEASAEPNVLAVLTDEELLALGGEDGLEPLGAPYLEQPAVDRDTAIASALRFLTARGLLNPTDLAREEEGRMIVGEGDPRDRLLQLSLGLAGLLTLRRIPEGMVVLRRVASDVTTTLGIYLYPDRGVLEEYVTADGLHHFSVPTLDAVPGRLREFVDPFGAAAADGEVEEIPVAQLDAGQGLEDTRCMTVVLSLDENPGPLATVFALSDRVRVLDHGASTDADPAPTDLLPVCDVSAETLTSILTTLIPEVGATP